MKKLLLFSLVCVFLFIYNTSIFSNEIKPEIYINNNVEIIETLEIQQDFLVIDNDTIHASGRSWIQQNGFPYFRIYILNSQDQTLNVTFTTSNGIRFPFTLPANSSQIFVGNNIPEGLTRADFSSPDGTVLGIINVRVSDMEL